MYGSSFTFELHNEFLARFLFKAQLFHSAQESRPNCNLSRWKLLGKLKVVRLQKLLQWEPSVNSPR
jgi:hypothetical protein